jgi:hypothetical protein
MYVVLLKENMSSRRCWERNMEGVSLPTESTPCDEEEGLRFC